jgi:hypothetical protein
MEHTPTKLVRSVLTLFGFGSLLRECRTGESKVADQLTVDKPKTRTRRAMKVRDMDKELVLALAAANVRHLGQKPRKLVHR